MVIGVEPLRHLERSDLRRAARGGEVAVELVRYHVVALGKRAEQDGRVEHLVVEAVGVRRHRVEAGLAHLVAHRTAQFGGSLEQSGLVYLSRPVGLNRLL